MVSATSYGEVLQIRMSRYPDFPTGTWVCAYLVDGLLFDIGPAHTAEELNRFLSDKVLKLAVNTHFHEDHISGNKFLQDTYGIDIYTHPLAIHKINKSAKQFKGSCFKIEGKENKIKYRHFEVNRKSPICMNGAFLYYRDLLFFFSTESSSRYYLGYLASVAAIAFGSYIFSLMKIPGSSAHIR